MCVSIPVPISVRNLECPFNRDQYSGDIAKKKNKIKHAWQLVCELPNHFVVCQSISAWNAQEETAFHVLFTESVTHVCKFKQVENVNYSRVISKNSDVSTGLAS